MYLFSKNVLKGVFPLLLFALTLSAQTEDIDADFNPLVTKNGVIAGFTALAQQNDSKIILAGDFDKINGISRNRIARLDADGSVDLSFNPGSGFDIAPTALAVQDDGKVLAGGNFTSFNGETRTNLIRLKQDGSAEDEFEFMAVTDQPVKAFIVQPDGKILIGGGFTIVNGLSRPALVRLLGDGSTDPNFTIFTKIAGTINSIALAPGGRVVVGGNFNIGGGVRVNLVRFNSNGEFDSFFNAGNIPTVKTIFRVDSKYLVIIDDSTLKRLLSFAFDDEIFQTVTVAGSINAVIRQKSGNIVLGGSFTHVNGVPRNNIARLRTNGVLESAFLPSGANGEVSTLAEDTNGKTLVGGNFASIGGADRTGLARVNPVPAVGGITYFDFDGDSRADYSVFRPSEGRWYIFLSASNAIPTRPLGDSSVIPIAADYTGDGRTDISVWRPTNGGFSFKDLWSSFQFGTYQFGRTGDDPTVTGDWNASGAADPAVFRPSTSAGEQSRFYYATFIGSTSSTAFNWGTLGDRPVRGDFDGDGKIDATVYRPSTGVWYILHSSNNTFTATQFGLADDLKVPADYDGDGRADIAVYRPAEGNWYRLNSSNGLFVVTQFGIAGDKPVPADYDGDGQTDLAVYRPSQGVWHQLRSSSGYTAAQFGISSDIPIPNVFVH